MTVGSTYAPAKYTGNSSTLDFTYSFPIGAATYLEVYLELISTGVQTLQTQGSDYTLVFDDTGGTVTFASAPTALQYIIISRNVAFEQQVSLTTSKVFDPKVIEGALDKLTEQTQQLKEFDTRVPSLPLGSPITSVSIPTPSVGKALLWNSTADNLINSTDDFNDIVTDATAQAGIATTQAGLATTQAGLATTQAGLANTARIAAELAETNAETAEALAEDWASKINGQVDSTDYSSKAYAIGGTGVTTAIGAAKEWAVTLGAAVIAGYYSAKEWAVGTFTRGASGGGSAKDWATYTSGTVDNAEYSAKYYANLADVDKIAWMGTWSAGTYNQSEAVEKDGTSYIVNTTSTSETPSGSATDWDVLALKGTDGTGAGDVGSNTTTSVDNEIVLFSGTGGKTIKRATTTGIVKAASGVISAAAAGTDYVVPSGSVATLTTARNINGMAFNGSEDINNYTTCSTDAGTAAKTAALTGFSLTTGARVSVLFSNANTAATPTLNVNSTGAVSIASEYGTACSATNPAYFPAGSLVEFVYDGTYFRFKNKIVRSYVNGTSWYKQWTDGFIRQGGTFSFTSGNQTPQSITFPLAFTSACLNIFMGSFPYTGGYLRCFYSYSYSTTTFSWTSDSLNASGASGTVAWEAAGY